MTFLTGSTRSRSLVEQLQRLSWGRMVTHDRIAPYTGEPWGLDNGAYVCWKRGVAWDEKRFREQVEWACSQTTQPYLAVLPDIVADPGSLAHSMRWFELLGHYPLPWYLAVQDGMNPAEVENLTPLVAGLFLGGTDRFKATAQVWRDIAERCGKRFHYARTSTVRKAAHALRVGADSADSAHILWTQDRFRRFERFLRLGSGQLALFAEGDLT